VGAGHVDLRWAGPLSRLRRRFPADAIDSELPWPPSPAERSAELEPLVAFTAAASLGLAGGLSPGPLTALVITRSLRYGPREGAVVALAPVITDGPLLLGGAALAGWMPPAAFGVIALVGAVFLGWLGWESLRAGPLDVDALEPPTGGVWRGVLTNLLNPHPYLFWIAIGGPLLARTEGAATAAFLAGFFGALCGSKAGMAVVVGRSRHLLAGRGYVWAQRGLGLAMWALAAGFVVDGLGRLGLVGG
jgi:threonine/homoserine/homoserine lactone efflux protein